MARTTQTHPRKGKPSKALRGKDNTYIASDNRNNMIQMQSLSNEYHVLKRLEERPSSNVLIEELQDITGLSLRQLAKNVYEMTPKTLSSYKNNSKHLSTRSMEISIKLKMLYEKASTLFKEIKHFNEWMQKECPGLGGRIPITLLNTSSGVDVIYEELTRIEFGANA